MFGVHVLLLLILEKMQPFTMFFFFKKRFLNEKLFNILIFKYTL